MVKVIASGVRKGNVIEHEDGKLYVVLKSESMHPGKGTPTTTIDMRRISDGVKTVVRYKTTDAMERAFVETVTHSYLYKDGDMYVFMNPESFEQISLHADMVGDAAPFLQEGMECQIALFNGAPISIELPQRVTLEIRKRNLQSRTRRPLRPSSRPCFPMACARWFRRILFRAPASWLKPPMAPMWSAPRTNG